MIAGLVAMVLSYNPKFTPSDAIRAILQGGTSITELAGKTSSGKAANAYGALTAIAAPTGLSAILQ